MTLAQARDRVDTWLANHWPNFVARQENFRANRGRYWQGLLTHTSIPNHLSGGAADAVADRLSVHPTDQFEDWKTAFPEWDGVPIPAAVKVDTYGGPQGQGWCATIYVRFNGTLYSRAQNVGPESYRTYGWRVEQAPE